MPLPGAENGGVLRRAAAIAIPVGAAGSAALTVYAGRKNSSLVLMTMFAIWAVSPYAGAMWAARSARSWPAPCRTALHAVVVGIAVCSLAIYGMATFGGVGWKLGFIFLVVPLACWLWLATVWLAARLRQ